MQLGSSLRGARVVAFLVAAAVLLSVPAIAAARVTVPPGATEGDQYFEEVPNGGGSASPTGGGSGGSGGSVAATQALDTLGAAGKTAAAIANANRPPQGGGDQPASPSTASTAGEGGMGFWFPLLLVATALAAIAYGLRRRFTTA